MTEQEYLEDNIATVAFHLGRPGARLSVQNDLPGLVVDPGEVLKEVSRRLDSHDALVAALKEAVSQLIPFAEDGDQPAISAAIDAGRKALSQARGDVGKSHDPA